jgi:hypothetical protein
MKDTARARVLAMVGLCLLTVSLAAIAKRKFAAKHDTENDIELFVRNQNMRDAVASLPISATSLFSRKPMHPSWVKIPEQHRQEMDEALLSSRRSRGVTSK